MISTESGKSVSYALWNLEERGALFIDAGMPVYQGMIIGEHARGLDLEVNPTKTKQLTNIRAAGKDDAVTLTTPITMSLEQSLAYIADDELVEVTPSSIRIRKLFLDPHERKREARKKLSCERSMIRHKVLTFFMVIFLFPSTCYAAPNKEIWKRWTKHAPQSEQKIDHQSWNTFLQRNVLVGHDGINRIDYANVPRADRRI